MSLPLLPSHDLSKSVQNLAEVWSLFMVLIPALFHQRMQLQFARAFRDDGTEWRIFTGRHTTYDFYKKHASAEKLSPLICHLSEGGRVS